MSSSDASNKALLDRVRDLLADRFVTEVNAVCVEISRRLYDRSTEASDADRKKLLAGASMLIGSPGAAFDKTLRAESAKNFDKRLHGDSTAAQMKTASFTLDSLTLQDDIAVQEEVALNDATKKLKELSDYEFFSLTLRLQSLMGRKTLPDKENPVLPRVYCRALNEGLTQIKATPFERLEIFQAFQIDLGELMPKIYHAANQMLIEQKVVPEITETYGKPIIRESRTLRIAGDDEPPMAAGDSGGQGGGGARGEGTAPPQGVAGFFQRMAENRQAAASASASTSPATSPQIDNSAGFAELLAQLSGGLAETRQAVARLGAGAVQSVDGRGLPSPLDQGNRTFIGSIAFLDIVDFSKLKVNEQMDIKDRFTRILAEAVGEIPADLRFTLDTGDGAALSFLGDPEDALFACMQMRHLLATESHETPISVRMGINLGPVKLVRDVNGQRNIVGDGINTAQRIMNFAPPGQIMVSRSYFDVVSVICEDYATLFVYKGPQSDKHARGHWVYQVGESEAAMARLKSGVAERTERGVVPVTGAVYLPAGTSADVAHAATPASAPPVDADLLMAITRLQAGWTMSPPASGDIARSAAASVEHNLDPDKTLRLPAMARPDGDRGPDETLRLPAIDADAIADSLHPDKTLRLPTAAAGGDDGTAMHPESASAGNVLHQVREMLAPQMTPVGAAVSELVASIFDKIFEDETTPEAIKALLGRLQLPALKAAMLNAELLTDSLHPMRILIDRIAQLGAQRGAALQPDSPLYQRLMSIVHSVQKEFVSDMAVVENALAELDVLLESEETAADAATAATAQRIEYEERLQMAQDVADREIARRLRAYRYPDVIDIFVTVAWRKVLRNDYLEGGENSALYQSSLTALNALLWSVRPDIVGHERAKLMKLIPALSERLNAGLDRVGIQPSGRTLFFEELVELHRKAMKSPTPPPRRRKEKTAKAAAPVESSPLPPEPPPAGTWPCKPPDAVEVTEPVVVAAPEVERGQWIQLKGEGDAWHSCKLTWISPSRENYVFKDYTAHEAITVTAFDLKNRLRSGSARRIDDSSLTQRSIDGAVASLMHKIGP